MAVKLSANVTKKVAKRLLRQDSYDREEALKNLYRQIYNEKESQILIDKFETNRKDDPKTALKFAEAAIESELNTKEADSYQPRYSSIDELEQRLQKLSKPSTKFKGKRNKIKTKTTVVNFAEERMKEATRNITKASHHVLDTRKEDLAALKDILQQSNEDEKAKLYDEIEMLKRTIKMQQNMIDDKQAKQVKQNSNFKSDGEELDKLLKEFDASTLGKNEKQILNVMKNEIANFTTKNISGCVERDVVKGTYTENIEKRYRRIVCLLAGVDYFI